MSHPQTAHFAWDLVDGVAVVDMLSRELNQPHEAEELEGQLRALIRSGETRKLLLNFRKTRFMSSTAFATLARVGKELNAKGGRMMMCGLDPNVRLGADILMLGRIIPIHDDETSALPRFRCSPEKWSFRNTLARHIRSTPTCFRPETPD